MNFGDNPPSGLGGDVVLNKLLTDDGQRTSSDHNSSPSAYGLCELKRK